MYDCLELDFIKTKSILRRVNDLVQAASITQLHDNDSTASVLLHADERRRDTCRHNLTSLESGRRRDGVQHLMIIDLQEADNVFMPWKLLNGGYLIVHGLELGGLGEHFYCNFGTMLLE